MKYSTKIKTGKYLERKQNAGYKKKDDGKVGGCMSTKKPMIYI